MKLLETRLEVVPVGRSFDFKFGMSFVYMMILILSKGAPRVLAKDRDVPYTNNCP